MTRTLDVDKLTQELAEQTVTIAGTRYRLVVKDNQVNRRLRDDSRALARLGRQADELTARTKQLEDDPPPTGPDHGNDPFADIAAAEEKLEDQVIALRRKMIAALIRDEEGKPPSAEVLDGLDSAVIARVFEFVLSDPLADQPGPDPTERTANGGGTPPS